MRQRYPMTGAQALFGALGGQSQQAAMDAELDRLSKLDMQRSQMGMFDARAEAERAEMARKQAEFESAEAARRRRTDPAFLSQVAGMRVPELAPADVNAVVRRGMGGPFEMPRIDPMQTRLIGETLASIFAGGAADAPTNAEQMAKVVTGAGSSAQRLQAPQIAAEDPITAAFMLNAGTDSAAPKLFESLPGGLGTFGTLTGAHQYDPGMKGAAIAKDEAAALASRGSAASSFASAANTRTNMNKPVWDAERGGFVDWRTGKFTPAMTPEGAPVGPKAQAAQKPHFDAARGVLVNPDGTATPVTMNGQPIGGKPLSPADQARVDKRNREAGAARAALDQSVAELDRLGTIATELKDHPGLPGITGLMSKVWNVPGTDRANAQAKLETLKSQVAFRVLQTMRDMSKTGGALGQVSDRENEMLKNNLAALDQAQSFEEFQRELGRIIEFVNGVKGRMEQAYAMQYGAVDAPPAMPRPGEIVDGYQFKGGDPSDPASWEPIQ